VRYAKAPVGALRWAPPQPPAAWTGVRATTSYGNRCPQTANTNGPLSLTEDCLFLNVQRPAGTAATDRLPVYFFIHGGGFTNGAGSQHDGTSIIQQTGVIVVTINYRLGVLGFLGVPQLTAQQGESGNYGLMDEISALGWVRRNIAAFGGDPGRVTIGGESAGANSVCALLGAPSAAGLFSGAIMESGLCNLSNSQTDTEFVGQGVGTQAGCTVPAHLLACLRGTSVQTLLDTWDNWGDPSWMVSGTNTLPLSPQIAVLQGKIQHVPLLVGSNRDEGRTLVADETDLMTKADYEAWLQNNSFSGDQAAAIEARYPWPANSNQFTGRYLAGAILTDGWFGIGGCPERDLVKTFDKVLPTYAYEFADRTGPGLRPEPVGYVWGAGHAAELPYMWPSFDNGTPITPEFSAGDWQLSEEMIASWGAFVKTGQPRAAGQPAWPTHNASKKVMSLRPGNASGLISDAAFSTAHQCSYWG
jgi:carboxylesterase type B